MGYASRIWGMAGVVGSRVDHALGPLFLLALPALSRHNGGHDRHGIFFVLVYLLSPCITGPEAVVCFVCPSKNLWPRDPSDGSRGFLLCEAPAEGTIEVHRFW